MRNLLIKLFGTKEKTAMWFFGAIIILVISIIKRDADVTQWSDWNLLEKTMIIIVIIDLAVSFGYFGKYPLQRSEMSEKQKRAADSI